MQDPGMICKFETCEKLIGKKSGKGYCPGHYKQLQEGRPLKELQIRRKGASCSFEGCSKPHDGHGLCLGHNRQRRDGQELRPLRQYIKNDESISEGQQLCRGCLIVKSQTEFYSHKGAYNDRDIYCKNCSRIRDKMRTFNLTFEDIIEIIQNQNGECAICGNNLEKKFAVDHCHKTGIVRGFLCSLCNSGIGLLRDSADICEKAAIYLRKFDNA